MYKLQKWKIEGIITLVSSLGTVKSNEVWGKTKWTEKRVSITSFGKMAKTEIGTWTQKFKPNIWINIRKLFFSEGIQLSSPKAVW